MRTPTKRKRPARRQPTFEEQRSLDERHQLARLVRHQRAVSALSRQLQRATERADRQLLTLARWIATRVDDRELSRKLQEGDAVASSGR